MANEKIIFDTEVKVGNSVGSVKSLKAELKELRNSLGTLEQGSEAFNKAAQRAGQLQEKIRGVNDAIENADPEKKFAPFSRTIQGMAGGFAALQGAMGLFGSESEELQKTLLKVQSAMALSEGLNSLLEFKNDFKDLGTMIINNVVKAFTTLRGAIIATGIGALAVTVGVLVTNWKEFSKAITNAFPAFKVVTDFFKNFRQIASGTLSSIVEGFKVIGEVISKFLTGDTMGAIESAKTFGERTAKAYSEAYIETEKKISIENGLKKRKQDLDLLEAQGKDVKNARIKLMQDELSLLEKGSEEYNAKLIEIEKTKTDIRNEAKAKKDKAEDEEKKKKDAFDKDNADRAKEYDDKANKKKEDDKNRKKSLLLSEQEQYASHINDLNEIAKDEVLSAEERYAALDELNKKGLLSDKQTSAAKLAIAQAEKDAKLNLLAAYGQTFNQIADLLGKSTAEGKAVAIAATTIDTYVAAFRAYKEGLKLDPTGTFSIIAAAAAAAAGIKAVQNIINTPVPGNSGGGGGGGGITAPSAPRIPQSFSGAKLGGNSEVITRNNGQVQKVIVTETDITKTQNNVKNIVSKATIR